MEEKDQPLERKEPLNNLVEKEHSPCDNDNKDTEQAQATAPKTILEFIRKPNEVFDACTPEELHKLCNNPLEPGCPVQLRQLTDEQILRIPFMRLAIRLMTILSPKEVKLTPKGALSCRVVNELYASDSSNVNSEDYFPYPESYIIEQMILLIALKGAGLIKTRLGKMSLTVKGKKLLTDYNKLLREIILFFFTKYNTGWYDQNGLYEVGNHGRLYSLWLLHHFGADWRPISFYTKEYFKAFEDLGSEYSDIAGYYPYRVFYRLFAFLGLCQINVGEKYHGPTHGHFVLKTPLLEMIFSFEELTPIQNN